MENILFMPIPIELNKHPEFPGFCRAYDTDIVYSLGFTQRTFTKRCINWNQRRKLRALINKPLKTEEEYFHLIRMADLFYIQHINSQSSISTIIIYDSTEDLEFSWDYFVNKYYN